MAWQTPKMNWTAGNVPVAGDFNRIEGNIQELQNTKETPAGAQAKVNTHAGSKRTHGISSGYYIAKTSRSDQLPAWNDIQGKPSVRTSFYKASGHTELTFSNIPSKSASPVREISIPAGSRVRVWWKVTAGFNDFAVCIETTPGVRGSFDSTYFAIMRHAVQIEINQGAAANSTHTNQDGDFMFSFDGSHYLYFKYLTNNKLMFFVYNNYSDARNYTLDVYWYILD